MAKKNINEINKEKFLELFEETYQEVQDERNRAMLAYKKVYNKLSTNEDIALMGKTANDFLKIVDNSHDKKIKLLRLYSDVMKFTDLPKNSDKNSSSELNEAQSLQEVKAIAEKLGVDVNDLIKPYK